MRKLRVGIWINEDYMPEVGGGFGYYTQLIDATCNYNFADADIVFIGKNFSSNWDKKDKSYKIQTPDFNPSVLPIHYRIVYKIAGKLRFG